MSTHIVVGSPISQSLITFFNTTPYSRPLPLSLHEYTQRLRACISTDDIHQQLREVIAEGKQRGIYAATYR